MLKAVYFQWEPTISFDLFLRHAMIAQHLDGDNNIDTGLLWFAPRLLAISLAFAIPTLKLDPSPELRISVGSSRRHMEAAARIRHNWKYLQFHRFSRRWQAMAVMTGPFLWGGQRNVSAGLNEGWRDPLNFFWADISSFLPPNFPLNSLDG